MALPVIHHRTPQFGAVLAEVQTGLRELFGTAEDVLILAASGTGAHGGRGHEPALARRRGHRRQRREVRRALDEDLPGLRRRACTRSAWSGDGRSRRRPVARALDAHPKARARLHAGERDLDLRRSIRWPTIAALTRERATRCSWSTASRRSASLDLPMDRLGIDVLVTGSQKALMLPPGLALRRALASGPGRPTERARLPRFYFDFRRERKGVARDAPPRGRRPSRSSRACAWRSSMMRAEGWPNVYARHDASRARDARRRRRRSASGCSRPTRRARRPPPSCCPTGVDGSAPRPLPARPHAASPSPAARIS